MTIWAVDANTGSVVAGRPVTLYDANDNLLGSGNTDADGLLTISLPPDRDPYTTMVAVLGNPGDPDYSVATTLWNDGISPWSYNINYDNNPPSSKIYLYTDRPIYQPGQTVYYRGILRQTADGRYQPYAQEDITLQVFGAFQPQIGNTPLLDTVTLPVSAYGTVQGEISLPEDADPGQYTIMPKDDYYNTLNFTVADYRKPEIEVTVNFDQAAYLMGQDVKADISAEYYFGGAASNVNVNWYLTKQNNYFDIQGGYTSGPVDTSWLKPNWYTAMYGMGAGYLLNGSGKTGPDGRLPLTFSADELKDLLDETQSTTLVLEATLADKSNQSVSQRSQVVVHPADFYAGIRPDTWSVSAGNSIGYSIQTVDWDGNPVGGKALTATFARIEWTQDWTNASLGSVDYQQVVTPVASADFVTDAKGRANLAFTPEDPGTYRLEVSGGGALSQSLMWVGGAGGTNWPALPDQHLELQADQTDFQAGDTAQIFLPNPFPSGALALVSIERGEVLRTQLVHVQGSSQILTVPLTNDDAPNVFVAVTLIGKDENGLPAFLQGYQELKVQANFLELQVSVTPAENPAGPGDTARFEVNVKDSLGNPIQGEFSFGAVDKAIYALAEDKTVDIRDAFYGEQPLGVTTSTSLAASIDRVRAESPGLGGGGGGEAAVVTSPGLRKNFEDTAYWNGAFETDASGNATIDFPLPDNLTTWVVTVRGLTRDTRVGEAKTELVVTKDLIVRPVTPQFLVAGDRVQLGALVNNTTASPLDVAVSIQANGVELEDSSQATQTVQVPAGGRQRVNWWVNVGGADAAGLVFSATAGDLSDSSTPTQGDIPILSYSSPQSFATSGILTDAGDYSEIVSLPRSYTPTGGKLDVSMTPSLAGAILTGLDAMKSVPDDFTEPRLSRLLANLTAYELVQQVPSPSPDLESSLQDEIRADLDALTQKQLPDGGWGWYASANSDLYLTSYALLVLSQASTEGFFVDSDQMQNAISSLTGSLYTTDMATENWQLDRLAFAYYALSQVQPGNTVPQDLIALRSQLNPWAQAVLALAIQSTQPDLAKTILSDLSAGALRTATGAHWQNDEVTFWNFTSPLSSTAMVIYALAEIDPASTVMAEAVNYVMSNRRPNGAWMSSFDTGWILASLAKAALATGELQANFSYTATLNDAPLASGTAQGADSLNSVQASVPLNQLAQSGNLLDFQRAAGNGRLYYQATLQVGQPVETIQPLDRGMTISRQYSLASADCNPADCPPVTSVDLNSSNPVVNVRLTVTVPEDTYYLAVEDYIPAGAEIVNNQLATAQVTSEETPAPLYDATDPLAEGWGRWYFNDPKIYSDHIRWIASFVPAGTYVLTYRLTPQEAGSFNVLPARAYQYYFPDVEGRSGGMTFEIKPQG